MSRGRNIHKCEYVSKPVYCRVLKTHPKIHVLSTIKSCRISQFTVSKRTNDPMYHKFSNMNMFFTEAFECDYSQHSIEEQHVLIAIVKFVEKNAFPCTFQYATSAHMNSWRLIQYFKLMIISQSWSEWPLSAHAQIVTMNWLIQPASFRTHLWVHACIVRPV